MEIVSKMDSFIFARVKKKDFQNLLSEVTQRTKDYLHTVFVGLADALIFNDLLNIRLKSTFF
jgi:hypothetical protein